MGEIVSMLLPLKLLLARQKRIRIRCRTCGNQAVLQGYYLAQFLNRHDDTMTVQKLKQRLRCTSCRDKRVFITVEATKADEYDNHRSSD